MLFIILSTRSSLLREDIQIVMLKSSSIIRIGFKGTSNPIVKSISESYVNRFTNMQVISPNFITFAALTGNCVSIPKQKMHHPYRNFISN